MRIYAHALLFRRGHDPADVQKSCQKLFPGCLVQTASAESATNGFFLEMIAAQTVQAKERGTLLARRPEIDFLLRLAGTSQISQAIPEVGSKSGEPFILVIAGKKALRRHTFAGGGRLPSRPLSASELTRVEEAALLNAERSR